MRGGLRVYICPASWYAGAPAAVLLFSPKAGARIRELRRGIQIREAWIDKRKVLLQPRTKEKQMCHHSIQQLQPGQSRQ